MSKNLLISNCRLLNSLQDKKTVAILAENGTITQIGKIEKGRSYDYILDAQGRIVTPGYFRNKPA